MRHASAEARPDGAPPGSGDAEILPKLEEGLHDLGVELRPGCSLDTLAQASASEIGCL